MHLFKTGALAVFCAVLVACGPAPSRIVGFQTTSLADLCARLPTADGMTLLEIETELGARGTTECRSLSGVPTYVGARTGQSVGQRTYSRGTAVPISGTDKNCSDFPSAAAAQRFFLAAGGPHRDPHGLDGDGDGNACEWGTQLREGARLARTYRAPAATVSPRPTYTSSRCYVGPRGGRYTLTASGRRNYNGC